MSFVDKIANFIGLAVNDPKAAAKKVEEKVENLELEDVSVFAKDVAKDAARVGGVILGLGLTSCTPQNSNVFHDEAMEEIDINSLKFDNREIGDYRKNKLDEDDKLPVEDQQYHHRTSDEVHYTYGYMNEDKGFKPFIALDGGTVLHIGDKEIKEIIPAKTVVNYINTNFDLLEKLGFECEFAEKDGKAVVSFGRTLTHTVGVPADVKPDSPLGKTFDMLGNLGLMTNNANNLVTKLDANNCVKNDGTVIQGGSYDGNIIAGFGLQLVEPTDLDKLNDDIKVKGNIQGLDFEGTLKTDDNGNVTIDDKSGNQIKLRNVTNYDIGSPEDPDFNDGVVVSVNGEDQYIMLSCPDKQIIDPVTGEKRMVKCTDIGKINRDKGTTIQHYTNGNEEFDLSKVVKTDEFYQKRYENLNEARRWANNDWYKIHHIGHGLEGDLEVNN